jgi:hypothetical protein
MLYGFRRNSVLLLSDVFDKRNDSVDGCLLVRLEVEAVLPGDSLQVGVVELLYAGESLDHGQDTWYALPVSESRNKYFFVEGED